MKLTVLGMNGPFPAANGACSGYLVQTGDSCLAMDLGCGTLAKLTALTPPEDLTGLLLSHWHSDHCSDVLPLIYRLESMSRAGGRLFDVWAPVDAHSPVRRAVQDCGAIRLHDLRDGETAQVGGLRVSAFRANHPVPTLMYRLTDGKKTLCYTGDTNVMDTLTDFAKEADLLLADGLFPEEKWTPSKPHLSAVKAAQLARDAGAKQLVITHLNPTIDPVSLMEEARKVYAEAVEARCGLRCEL